MNVMTAAALGAGMVLSTQASLPLEHIAQAMLSDAGRGPLWFQLYLQHDRGFTQALVQRAEAALEQSRRDGGDAPEHLPVGVDDVPAATRGGRFCAGHERRHP